MTSFIPEVPYTVTDSDFTRLVMAPIIAGAGRFQIESGHPEAVPEHEFRFKVDKEEMVLEYRGAVYRVALREFVVEWLKHIQEEIRTGGDAVWEEPE